MSCVRSSLTRGRQYRHPDLGEFIGHPEMQNVRRLTFVSRIALVIRARRWRTELNIARRDAIAALTFQPCPSRRSSRTRRSTAAERSAAIRFSSGRPARLLIRPAPGGNRDLMGMHGEGECGGPAGTENGAAARQAHRDNGPPPQTPSEPPLEPARTLQRSKILRRSCLRRCLVGASLETGPARALYRTARSSPHPS